MSMHIDSGHPSYGTGPGRCARADRDALAHEREIELEEAAEQRERRERNRRLGWPEEDY